MSNPCPHCYGVGIMDESYEHYIKGTDNICVLCKGTGTVSEEELQMYILWCEPDKEVDNGQSTIT